MGTYRLSKAADKDFELIFDYGIDQFGLDQAYKYQGKLVRRFEAIAESPYQYPSVEYIRPGYRRSICGVHAIYYRIRGEMVEIVRILGRQEPSKRL